MTASTTEIITELESISNPAIDGDIVETGLVVDVTRDGSEVTVTLAVNTPFAPIETELGSEIREAIEALGFDPTLRASVTSEQGFDDQVLPGVRNVVAVASGKGGVGKTTVAGNLAAGLDDLGAHVGLLDADVHGPNAPRVLPVEGDPGVTPEGDMIPPDSAGVNVMSAAFLMDDDDPAILRGPMVNDVMRRFVEDVEWGRLDYLVVDLPPGTGDASLNLLQTLPLAGVVTVTTPQEMAVDDTRKGIRLFERHDAPLLGVVENMSGFTCPSCGDAHDPFGEGQVGMFRERYGVDVLGRLPIHPAFDTEANDGPAIRTAGDQLRGTLRSLVEDIVNAISEANLRKVAESADEETAGSAPLTAQ
ncbi:Mrp/NBP35 family ATP-binding protein [Halorubrum vacuolatum]|uniref:Iron-sulfur cluster carrier protein n=1 Tax=Halorubrum vacuolatum TaxID=63740 RepID=A0A238V8Z7_HALVU|nr:Mrp/NBP35 family ATP-binding protein [Halorubrum vacuolatum]SNR30584.1 ATP-binding protein involved in chromosome partitioning [Halorubrum vacuolatum]